MPISLTVAGNGACEATSTGLATYSGPRYSVFSSSSLCFTSNPSPAFLSMVRETTSTVECRRSIVMEKPRFFTPPPQKKKTPLPQLAQDLRLAQQVYPPHSLSLHSLLDSPSSSSLPSLTQLLHPTPKHNLYQS
ncbi:hypothetical protein Leryth_010121 [Lithospermum erythrorhizon]|nr:hypothetical protein Leryth_010121 [Lithospermum erythrorhizon]